MKGGAQAEAGGDVISVDEVTRGQTGYGVTVFEGTETERFDVEVVGVLRNFNPGVSFILARLSGRGLEESGVAGGMSGSPVYLDGKLAGAVAFSWDFSTGALAGITPIDAMRDLGALPGGAPAATSPALGRAGAHWQRLLDLRDDPQKVDASALDEALSRFAPTQLGAGAEAGLTLAAAGLGAQTRGRLERLVGGLAPAGRMAETESPPEIAGGSAVSAIMVGGDLQMSVNGTVTERNGDELVAFGHPWLGIGEISVPMAAAEVVTVVASRRSSFKVSNTGPVIGAFDQDRFAGMRGQIGAQANTTPMTVKVSQRDATGAAAVTAAYDLELADLPILRPSMVAVAMLQALESGSRSSGDQSLEMRLRVDLEGHDPIAVSQSFEGTGAGTSAAIYLLSLVGFLETNRFEDVDVRSIDVELDQWSTPRVHRLRRVVPSRRELHPGDTVTLYVESEEYRGGRVRDEVEVTIPSDAREGSYYLFVGDGPSIDSARLQIEPNESKGLDDSLSLLRSFSAQDELVVLGVRRGSGLVRDGRALPSLPGSVRSTLAGGSGVAAKRLQLEIVTSEKVALGRPLDGLQRVDLKILPERETR